MRELRLAREAVRRFALDLTPYTVFTECATGHFAWTAALALLAGAPRVLALARGTRFGSAAAAAEATRAAAEAVGGADRLHVVHDHARIGEADIVTNTGAVRPLDAAVVARMRPGAVVPLMWETWEFRPSDLDLPACGC